MHLTTALLCDFAQVREGLLFVASGGITRMWRPELPAPLGVMLAVVIELDQIEAQRPHEFAVHCMAEDGQRVLSFEGGFQVSGPAPDMHSTENYQVPISVDLRFAGVDRYGAHDLKIYADGNHLRTLTFWVAPSPPPQLPFDESG